VRGLSKNAHRQDLERLRVIGYGKIWQLPDGSLTEARVRELTLLATWKVN
jgi:hypothetical protein